MTARPGGDEAKSLFARCVDSLESGVVVIDRSFRIALSNRYTQTWVKLAAAELEGERCHRVFHGREAPCPDCPSEAVLRTGEPASVTHAGRDGEGRETQAALTLHPIFDHAGEVEYFLEQVVDVSMRTRTDAERSRLLAALSLSESRYRTVVECSHDAIFILDAAGGILWSNPRASRMCGGVLDDQVGTRFTSLLVESRRAEAERSLALAFTGTPQAWETQLRCSETRVVELEIHTEPLSEAGRVIGTVGFAKDVTSQRRAEADLRQSEAMYRQAQKMEAVGRLAGGVAHDFNNLLTVILTWAEMLRDDVGAGRTANASDVHSILDAAERARDLTRHLLAFARKEVVVPAPLELNETVRGSMKLLRRILGEDITLRVELATTRLPIHADRGQIEQVLLNLVINARDAMPRGGTLTVRTFGDGAALAAQTSCAKHGAGDWVRLSVIDTGTGMSPEVMTHLFEPFFTTKEQGRGTGLGLATVYGVVTQSGGHLHVESEPGKGACFEACLPRSPLGELAADKEAPAGPRGGAETILFVEDDALVRDVTARVLRGAGNHLIVARDGVEALTLLAAALDPIDLVITDVVMPGLGGVRLSEALRQKDATLPILLVSGYPRGTASPSSTTDGEIELLPKPFTAEILLSRVRTILDARKAAGAAADHPPAEHLAARA